MADPRVLVFDIETAPILAYVWGLKDQNIGLNQIKEDWYVLAWAAKWLNEDYIWYADQSKAKDKSDDRLLLNKIWQLLDEADIVITQYGSGFDAPKLNTRFVIRGMKPPSPYKHLDTYRIAKRSFAFTSNKLEYLTDKLCTKYKKLSHSDFPGMSLWTECLSGNKDAWTEMKKYNIHDVLSTEELYNKVKAWTPAAMASRTECKTACRVCTNKDRMWHKGYEYKKAGKYNRYQCQKCYAWTTGDKVK